MFYGAGEAGVGIANLVATYIQRESGCSESEAKSRIWLVDSKGLVDDSRNMSDLAAHKVPYAHHLEDQDCPFGVSEEEETNGQCVASASKNALLDEAIVKIRPTALIGVSAQSGAFDKGICQQMTRMDKAPLIMSLSNPTSKSEVHAKDCYEWTDGAAVYASGSPYPTVELSDGRKFEPGQGNNA